MVEGILRFEEMCLSQGSETNMCFTSSFLRGVEEVKDKNSVLGAANNHMTWSLINIYRSQY